MKLGIKTLNQRIDDFISQAGSQKKFEEIADCHFLPEDAETVFYYWKHCKAKQGTFFFLFL